MEISIAESAPSADEALARLVAGNERFLRGEAHYAGHQPETLADLAGGNGPTQPFSVAAIPGFRRSGFSTLDWESSLSCA